MRRLATLAALAVAPVLPAAAQTFDVTVAQIFAVSQDSLAKAVQLQTAGTLNGATYNRLTRSRYTDLRAPVDTLVRFTAVLLSDPRSSGNATATQGAGGRVGRIHVFVRDVAAASGGTIQRGFVAQIVDGGYEATGLNNLAPGAVIKITGSLAYFTNQPQISPTTIELINLDYRAAGYPDALARPITTTLEQINRPAPPIDATTPQATLNFTNHPANAFEYVRIEGLQVETNAASLTGRFNVSYANSTRTSFIYQGDLSLRYRNDRNTDATYTSAGFNVRTSPYVPPAVGARVNLEGFTLPFTGDFVNRFYPESGANTGISVSLTPFEDGDVQVLAGAPPSVANARRTGTGIARGTSAVQIAADVAASPDRTVASATLFYRLSGSGTYASVAMTAGTPVGGSTPFTGNIPTSVLADGAFIEYYVRGTDNTGANADSPAQTFRVLANGIRRVEHIQRTASGGTGDSPFATLALSGTDLQLDVFVASRPDTTGFVSVQDDPASGPWSGIQLEGTAGNRVLRVGEQITITAATVTESFGLTTLTGVTFTRKNTTIAFGPATRTTDQILAAPESFESVLLRIAPAVVISNNPDAPTQFGEFSVASTGSGTSGTAALRVDDRSTALAGKGYNATLKPGDRFASIEGILSYANNNFKLLPQVASDFVRTGVAADGVDRLGVLSLGAVSPNPVRGSARVAFRTDAAGAVTLDVYDVLGRRVASLLSETLAPGEHVATLDASALPAGVYVVRLAQGASSATRTVVVQ